MTYIFRHTAFLSTLSVCIVGLCITSGANGGSVLFDFVDNGSTADFDSALAGATMTRDEGGAEAPITITSLEIKAPTYVSGVWDGSSYNVISKTNIPGNDSLAIDNLGSGPPFPSDSSGIDPEESWTFEFDVPVVFNQIDLTSFSGGATGDKGLIKIGGATVLNFSDADLDGGDNLDDPFGVGTVIPAGTSITFQGVGDANANPGVSHWRIDTFTVTEVPKLILEVDRDTGGLALKNTTGSPINILGYSISSSNGAFVAANWKTITGNYDDSTNGGDESVDDDEAWTILGGTTDDLSEYVFGGNGGNVAGSASVDLSQGSGAWLRTPNEESLSMEVMLFDGSLVNVLVEYQGNGDEPLMRSDLNIDGSITSADWDIFLTNHFSDLSSLTLAQAYGVGDLDGDLDNDPFDFAIFQSDYDLVNGSGSFSAMLQSVPEPSSLFLLGLGILGCCLRRRA